jgi:hypothetical protein
VRCGRGVAADRIVCGRDTSQRISTGRDACGRWRGSGRQPASLVFFLLLVFILLEPVSFGAAVSAGSA